MSEPQRLLGSGTEFERSLLGSVVGEQPNAVLTARMEQGLGIAPVAAPALSIKAAAAFFGTAAAGALGFGLVTLTDADPPPRVAAPSAVALAPMAAPAEAEETREAERPARPPVTEAAPNAAVPNAAAPDAAAPNATVPNTAVPTTLPEAVEKRTVARASKAPGLAKERASAAQLREEVRWLDRARTASMNGRTDTARATVDGYFQRFPNGILAPEARRLRASLANGE